MQRSFLGHTFSSGFHPLTSATIGSKKYQGGENSSIKNLNRRGDLEDVYLWGTSPDDGILNPRTHYILNLKEEGIHRKSLNEK